MVRRSRGVRGVAGLALSAALASACGGSGSGADDDAGDGGRDEVVTVVRREVGGSASGFDVAAGQDTGWLLVTDEVAQVWEIGSDGTLTRRSELDGGDEIAAFGDGAAVARFRCTDATDDECGAPVADLVLVDPDGSVGHELTLAESDAGGLEAVGMRILGASDRQIWVETTVAGVGLFAVSRSGEVETVPAARRRPFASDQICVVDGELLAVRVHTDLYDPEQGPPDTGVALSSETPIRTTVGFESFTDDGWHPVEGSERTFDLRGDEARAVCGSESVRVEGAGGGAGSGTLARWTHDGGWVAAPAGIGAAPPPGSVGVDGCDECVWGRDGEILRRGDDGAFRATGLVVADPDGADDPPEATEVEVGPDGATAVCASFPRGGAPPVAPTAPPSTVTGAAGLAGPGPWVPRASGASGAAQEGGRPLVCDR